MLWNLCSCFVRYRKAKVNLEAQRVAWNFRVLLFGNNSAYRSFRDVPAVSIFGGDSVAIPEITARPYPI